MPRIKVGDVAPDFELPAVIGERRHTFRLSDYRGKKNVVLAFYALNWTPVWAAQMPAYDRELEKFAGLDAQVVGIAADSVYSHMAWQQKEIGLLHYPLCSDFYPHVAVAEKYGVVRMGPPQPGISERSIFIVDKQGKVAFAKVYPLDQIPDMEEIFAALRGLSTEVRAAV